MMTYVTIAQHFSVVSLLLYPHVNKCTVSLMITIPYPHLATLVFLLTILTSHLIILITALHCYDVIRQQALYLGMGYKLVYATKLSDIIQLSPSERCKGSPDTPDTVNRRIVVLQYKKPALALPFF